MYADECPLPSTTCLLKACFLMLGFFGETVLGGRGIEYTELPDIPSHGKAPSVLRVNSCLWPPQDAETVCLQTFPVDEPTLARYTFCLCDVTCLRVVCVFDLLTMLDMTLLGRSHIQILGLYFLTEERIEHRHG